MLGKLIFALILLVILAGVLYLFGTAVYNHFLNSRRKDIEDLRTESDRLQQLLKEIKQHEA